MSINPEPLSEAAPTTTTDPARERLLRERPWLRLPSRSQITQTKPYAKDFHGSQKFDAEHTVAIRWIVPSAERYHYGWTTAIRSFTPDRLAEAIEFAKQSMGIALSVEVVQFDWSQPVTINGMPNPLRGVVHYTRKNRAVEAAKQARRKLREARNARAARTE